MILDVLAAVLVLGGSALALTAAIGVVRFPDTLSRMHSASKPQVLGCCWCWPARRSGCAAMPMSAW